MPKQEWKKKCLDTSINLFVSALYKEKKNINNKHYHSLTLRLVK